MNRIYLFLPEAPKIETLILDGRSEDDREYEVFVISQNPEFTKNDIRTASGLPTDQGENWFSLYTNLGVGDSQEQPVSYNDAEERLYHLRVAVCRAAYPADGSSLAPEAGEELLVLDSAKSE